MESDQTRRLRSFVLRQGRMTSAQQRGFADGMQRFGLQRANGVLDLETVFERRGCPTTLEIGFGMGDSLLSMAEAEPLQNFIGVEVHRPGVGRLLNRALTESLTNIRVFCDDAVDVLEQCIAPATLDTVQIFFPDPWHKKRHNKRRLIQPPFVALLCRRLKPGGRLHLATDWADYAEQMLEVLRAEPLLTNHAASGGFVPREQTARPPTKFEQRGERLGHAVFDLVFIRTD
jgi:tRNA (guanine-N7-)-methyltransferase